MKAKKKPIYKVCISDVTAATKDPALIEVNLQLALVKLANQAGLDGYIVTKIMTNRFAMSLEKCLELEVERAGVPQVGVTTDADTIVRRLT